MGISGMYGIVNVIDAYFYIMDKLQGTYTLRILHSFFELFLKIGPYLVISILVQVLLNYFVQGRKNSLYIKNRWLAVITGSALGMLSPLPTYAAIPIGLSLIPLGLPFGAVMAFAIASPLINPSVFFLTLTQMGTELALARIVSTLVISLAGGLLFSYIKIPLLPDSARPRTSRMRRPIHTELWRSTLFFTKYFSIAILISAAVKALVSPQFVTQILGQQIERSLLVAIALGVPFYSCGGAAIPFVEVLSDMGMDKGAVLTFFIAGPVTKLETMYIFKSLLGIKYFIIYILLTLSGAFGSGLLFSMF